MAAQVDPNRFLDQFGSTFGKFDGIRRPGVKGVCAVGEFASNEQGRLLSTASAFSRRPLPVIVRVSVGGANPPAPDNMRSQPVQGVKTLSDEEAKATGPQCLFDGLRQSAAAGGVAFNVNLQLAQAGDLIASAVVPLPEDRRKVTLARLTIKSVSADAKGDCVGITFNAIVLPKGIEPSADRCCRPVPRPAPCSVGLGRRSGEGAKQ